MSHSIMQHQAQEQKVSEVLRFITSHLSRVAKPYIGTAQWSELAEAWKRELVRIVPVPEFEVELIPSDPSRTDHIEAVVHLPASLYSRLRDAGVHFTDAGVLE